MSLAVTLLIQLVVLVIAMVIASLILRWILANPEKCKQAWRKTKRIFATPFVHGKAYRAYLNWKKVRMGFSYQECLQKEWQKYEKDRYPDQTYYRS